MNKIIVTAALLSLAAPAFAETKASVSESFTGGSGPFVGNSLTAGFSPGPLDVDVGYDFGSDQDLALYHEVWGSLGFWPGDGVRLSIEGSYGPTTSSTTADRGFFSLGSQGFGGSISFHPGHSGDVRPYLEVGASYDHYDVTEGTASASPVAANFTQTGVRGAAGIDVGDTSFRVGGSKFFYGADAASLDLPPGVGGGPSGVGAVSGALPTRAEDWNVRASIRQAFGGYRDWDVQVGASYGPYVDDDGNLEAVNVRLSHKFGRSVRAHVGLTGQVENLAEDLGGTRGSVFANAGITLLF